jgi:hypothetical protein
MAFSGMKTSAKCSAKRFAFSLLLLAHGPAVGVSLRIGGFGVTGFLVKLVSGLED